MLPTRSRILERHAVYIVPVITVHGPPNTVDYRPHQSADISTNSTLQLDIS